MSDSGYAFIIASWKSHQQEIRTIREQVFFSELNFPKDYIDTSKDEDAYHVMVYDSASRPVGTASMQKNGNINYVAVLSPWRGFTVGGALVSYLVHIASALKLDAVWTQAPLGVKPFLEKNRFSTIEGEESVLLDIPFCKMVRNINQPSVVH